MNDFFSLLPYELLQALKCSHMSDKVEEESDLWITRTILLNEQKVGICIFLNKYNIIPQNFDLYVQAFTHRSYANFYRSVNTHFNYNRLEFLGDSVVNFCVTAYLFKKFPHADEGKLTVMRKSAVQKQAFYLLVKELGLMPLLRMVSNNKWKQQNFSVKFVSNLFESLVGAIYLDQGMKKTVHFLEQTLFKYIDKKRFESFFDWKTNLQEIAHQNQHCKIFYKETMRHSHAKANVFHSTVYLVCNNSNYAIGTGKGISKKAAQQEAAMNAIKNIKKYLS